MNRDAYKWGMLHDRFSSIVTKYPAPVRHVLAGMRHNLYLCAQF